MECIHCSELGRLLSHAENKHAEIRAREIVAIRAFDEVTSRELALELALSGTVVEILRTKLRSHETSHAKKLTSGATGL